MGHEAVFLEIFVQYDNQSDTGSYTSVGGEAQMKLKKYLGPWEGPYRVMARISKVEYKVSKLSK